MAIPNPHEEDPIPLLRARLGDSDIQARLDAVLALQRIGSREAQELLLEAVAGDADAGVRESAVYAAAEIAPDDPWVTLRLASQITRPPDSVREAILTSMKFRRGPEAVRLLTEFLGSDSTSLRERAAIALQYQDGPGAKEQLQQTRDGDPDCPVREAARISLRALRDEIDPCGRGTP